VDLKTKYTKLFLLAAGADVTETSIKKHRSIWWSNVRATNRGLRLTEKGLQFLLYRANIKSYDMKFNFDGDITAQLLLQLDEFITCPWYISHGIIILFGEQMAMELSLFSGDLKKLGNNKASNKKFHQELQG
jgi:hypothetical protein